MEIISILTEYMLNDIMNHTVGKALDQFDISHELFKPSKEQVTGEETVKRTALI